jgi:cullin-5
MLKIQVFQFEDKWPAMRPTVLKVLRQETVSRSEWHDLFMAVHSLCLWDENGAPKVLAALRNDILDFIKQAQKRVLSHEEDCALLKAYIAEWNKFFTQCHYQPKPFSHLETTLETKRTKEPKSTMTKKPEKEESIVRKVRRGNISGLQ